MYDYLKGELTYLTSHSLVVECSGVGYSVLVPERWLQELSGRLYEEIVVYTHAVLRETEHLLFGFHSREERECFRTLISFSGIGPKIAVAILNTFSLSHLSVIAQNGDVDAISCVPGIGKKTAEKLMVDLKQKLPTLLIPSSCGDRPLFSKRVSKSLRADEGIKALVSLGFAKGTAERVVMEAVQECPEATLEQILPLALKKI